MPNEDKAHEYDPEIWQNIQQRVTDVESTYSAWKVEAKKYEDILLMEWEDDKLKETSDETKITISPDGANRLIGAHRLISATKPQISVRFEDATADEMKKSAEVERFLRAIWNVSGQVYGAPLHLDVTLSALTYADVHFGCRLVADMLEAARELDDRPTRERQIRRLEAIQEQTPLIYDIYNPRQGMAEYDSLGLVSYTREWKTTPAALVSEWPEAANVVKAERRGVAITVKEYVDDYYRCLWVQGAGSKAADRGMVPFFLKEHGLGFIPVGCYIIEGSKLFDKPEHQRRPFLYTLVKSGLQNRQNLVLTVLYTTVFSIAALAYWKHQRGSSDSDLRIEKRASTLGIAELGQGEDLQPMLSKGAIDPALVDALQIAQKLTAESTIQGQTLGEPLGSNAPYSMVALLHQAGRLPLVTPQEICGWAIADMLKLGMRLLQHGGQAPSVLKDGKPITVNLTDLNPNLPLRVLLEIDLPQDWPQMARVALDLINGELASRRYIRENIMHAGDSDRMDEEIWNEGAANTMYKLMLQASAQQMMAPPAAPPPGGGGGGQTNEQAPPGGMGSEGPAPGGSPVEGETVGGVRPGQPMTEPATPRGMPG
jgi:hypothetical protein